MARISAALFAGVMLAMSGMLVASPAAASPVKASGASVEAASFAKRDHDAGQAQQEAAELQRRTFLPILPSEVEVELALESEYRLTPMLTLASAALDSTSTITSVSASVATPASASEAVDTPPTPSRDTDTTLATAIRPMATLLTATRPTSLSMARLLLLLAVTEVLVVLVVLVAPAVLVVLLVG